MRILKLSLIIIVGLLAALSMGETFVWAQCDWYGCSDYDVLGCADPDPETGCKACTCECNYCGRCEGGSCGQPSEGPCSCQWSCWICPDGDNGPGPTKCDENCKCVPDGGGIPCENDSDCYPCGICIPCGCTQ